MATIFGGAAAPFAGQEVHENGFFEDPVDGTYTVLQAAAYPIDLVSITAQTVSGTVSGTVLIDGSPVGGMTNLVWSSTASTASGTSGNSVPSGGKIALALSGATAYRLSWTYKTLRGAG